MITKQTLELAKNVNDWAQVFAGYQTSDGSVDGNYEDYANASVALERTTEVHNALCQQVGGIAVDCAELFKKDASNWINNGLHNAPDFSHTHAEWKPPSAEQEVVPFLAPVRIPNGIRGDSFILNFALTQKRPDSARNIVEEATSQISNPEEVVIVNAPIRSIGYSDGDGSVLFSELMASSARKGPQTFGAFIVTDFYRHFTERTLGNPIMKGPRLFSALELGTENDTLDERSLWLQIHDRFHGFGDMPYNVHLPTKMHFSAAVLDEVKAGGSSYLALSEISGDWEKVATRQILDKMLRFPFSPFAFMGIDGAVGELFFKEALSYGALVTTKSGDLELNTTKLWRCIDSLVASCLEIEKGQPNQDIYIENTTSYLADKGIALPPHRTPLDWRH